MVALCLESVDWNWILVWAYGLIWSLSAWRAWIEISWVIRVRILCDVALCLESVDWNPNGYVFETFLNVALCLESVDWNIAAVYVTYDVTRRSLLGERGLKFHLILQKHNLIKVALCLESVDWNKKWKHAKKRSWEVALCLESVDWNGFVLVDCLFSFGRSLLGERGLK